MTDVSIGEGAPLLVEEEVASLASGEMGSGVSWAAIIAGAFVASAFALALVALGAGIGLISVSPWSANNPSVTAFGALAAAWFIAVELFACGLGGYLAGRLRTRWARVHDDEVYFRDTAHGLLVWAVAAVFTAALLALSAASALSGAAHLVGAAAQTAATTGEGASIANPTDYFADAMLRTDHPPIGDQTPTVMETRRILARALVSGELPDADKTYLATVVFNRTGMSTADSEKRVADVFAQAKGARDEAATKAKEAADAARKTGVYAALWAFVSLLVGAVSASYMATVGGRVRDDLPMAG